MSSEHSAAQRSWWKLVLTGVMAFAFGIAAVVLPAGIMLTSILDVLLGKSKPFSGSLTALAALLALVAVVAFDGMLHLVGAGVTEKRAGIIRGAVGVAVAIAAIFWPGMTAYVAVELIGLWAIVIGVIELMFARTGGEDKKDRALLIIAATAAIVVGVGMMRWVFVGAVLVGVVVGIAAAARGVSLIVSGIVQRTNKAPIYLPSTRVS